MSTTLTLVMCSLLFFPLNRDAAQHQRNRSLNSQTDSEILYIGHLETKLTKQLQSGKLWRSFWTGVISALGYPSEVPFRIWTYDSAAYKQTPGAICGSNELAWGVPGMDAFC